MARIEAESLVQKALSQLSSAATAEKEIAEEHSTFVSEKERIEIMAVERALKTAADETARLKRQHESASLARLPTFSKKPKLTNLPF